MAPTIDIAGNPRPAELPLKVDLGCYEYVDFDSDGDGVLDIGKAAFLSVDSDQDGFNDYQEMMIGTDRYNSEDYFRITHDHSLQEEAAMIAWQSVSGCIYTVQFTDSLLNAWVNVQGWVEVSGTGEPMVCEDTRTEGNRFYRVLVRIP
jgi:hypothetical protein